MCKEFKDLILTDYIDGELDKEMLARMENHLLACPQCRDFAAEVKTNLAASFQHAGREAVPEALWPSIKERIAKENDSGYRARVFREGLIESFSSWRLALSVMSFVVLVITGFLMFGHQQNQQAKEDNQGEYLVSVFGPASTLPETDSEGNGGLGTPIEQYFL